MGWLRVHSQVTCNGMPLIFIIDQSDTLAKVAILVTASLACIFVKSD